MGKRASRAGGRRTSGFLGRPRGSGPRQRGVLGVLALFLVLIIGGGVAGGESFEPVADGQAGTCLLYTSKQSWIRGWTCGLGTHGPLDSRSFELIEQGRVGGMGLV